MTRPREVMEVNGKVPGFSPVPFNRTTDSTVLYHYRNERNVSSTSFLTMRTKILFLVENLITLALFVQILKILHYLQVSKNSDNVKHSKLKTTLISCITIDYLAVNCSRIVTIICINRPIMKDLFTI